MKMVFINEDCEFECNWILRRYGRFIQDIQIDLDDDEIVLGRGYNKGINYAVGVSRRHALLKRITNGKWKIKDLGSVNGLFVNATKVSENCFEYLEEFDIVGLGVANAVHEEHFSFMLCRKPQFPLKDRELLKLPPVVLSSIESISNNGEQNLNLKEENKNINDCKKEKTSTDFINTLQKDDEIEILFQTTNNKWQAKEIIILSEDTDSEDEIVRLPRKRRKLRKRKPIVTSSEDSDCTSDEMVVNNMFLGKSVKTSEGIINFGATIKEENVKPSEFYHHPYREKPGGNQDFHSDQKSKQNSIIDVNTPVSKPTIVKQDCMVKRECNPVVDSSPISEESLRLTEQSANCVNLLLNFDISVAIREQEKFYSQATNVVIISDEEDFEGCKQNELAEIKKEIDDSYLQKEPTDVSANQKDDDSFKDDQCSDDEMHLDDTVDDFFDYGGNIDYSVNEEELLARLVWPSNSDDWNKENVSDIQSPQIPSNSDEIDVHSDNEKAKEMNIHEKVDTLPAQIKSIKTKSPSNPIKIIEALPMLKPSYRHSHSASLQDNIRGEMGYCLPCPGGGSAIRKDDTSDNLRSISSVDDIKRKNNNSWSNIIEETIMKLPMGDNNAYKSKKPKNTYKTQIIQRFASRTDLLLQSMLQSNSAIRVNKPKM